MAEYVVYACLTLTEPLFFCTFQGHQVAELILHHARANECRDVEAFKDEMATLVTQARKNTITLEKVGRCWGAYCPCSTKREASLGSFQEGGNFRIDKDQTFFSPHLPVGIGRAIEIPGSPEWPWVGFFWSGCCGRDPSHSGCSCFGDS